MYAVARDGRFPRSQPWSPIGVQGVAPTNGPYDLHPDGKRIAAAPLANQTSSRQDHVVFISNFPEWPGGARGAEEVDAYWRARGGQAPRLKGVNVLFAALALARRAASRSALAGWEDTNATGASPVC